MKRLRLSSEGGFTLIELLVVIAIIGILAAIAVPQFAAYRRRGFESEALSSVRNLATAQEGYYAVNNEYKTSTNPGADFVNIGFTQTSNISITTTSSGSSASATFTITGSNTKCNSGGTYTYSSVTGKIALVSPCS